MDGKEFLRRMAQRDPQVFDDLMKPLDKLTRAAARTFGIFDSRADDIVQDVAMKVFERWESFNNDSSLATWIYAIARNRCLDEVRRNRVRNEVSAHADDDGDAGGLDLIAQLSDDSQSNWEQRLCVQAVLDALEAEPPAREGSKRKIDVLRWWVENSPSSEELASFMKTTVGAARERKSYILREIRALCLRFCGHSECAVVGN